MNRARLRAALPLLLAIFGFVAPPAWIPAFLLSLRQLRHSRDRSDAAAPVIAALVIAAVGLGQILVWIARAVPIVARTNGRR